MFASYGTAHNDLLAFDAGGIESVQGMPVFEHAVVGDIDDIVDRAHAGVVQPVGQPERRGCDVDSFEIASGIARAQSGSFNGDGDFGRRAVGRCIDPGRRDTQGSTRRRSDLPRQPDHTETIGTIRRDEYVDDIIGLTQPLSQILPGPGVLIEEHQPLAALGQSQFRFGTKHAVAGDAADFTQFDSHSFAKAGSRQGQGNEQACAGIGSTTDNTQRLSPAGIHPADLQFVSSGMRSTFKNPADDDAAERTRHLLDRFNLQTRHGQGMGQFLHRKGDIDIFLEPAEGNFHFSGPDILELFEKTQIIIEENADIIDLVFQQGDALHPHAKGIAAVEIGIIIDETEDGWIDHTGSGDFEPSALFAETAALALAENAGKVIFSARFGEGEKAGPEPDANLFVIENLLGESEHDAFKVSKRDAAVDDQSLDLVKGWRMGGIRGIFSEAAAGCDHAYRRFLRFHCADLHRRGMGPEHKAAIKIKGILHVARGVILGDIEGRKVVVFAFDFRPLLNTKAHAGEDLLDFIHNLKHRMEAADRWIFGR